MIITYEDGLYHCCMRGDDRSYLSYSPDRKEAIKFCIELLKERIECTQRWY